MLDASSPISNLDLNRILTKYSHKFGLHQPMKEVVRNSEFHPSLATMLCNHLAMATKPSTIPSPIYSHIWWKLFFIFHSSSFLLKKDLLYVSLMLVHLQRKDSAFVNTNIQFLLCLFYFLALSYFFLIFESHKQITIFLFLVSQLTEKSDNIFFYIDVLVYPLSTITL